LPQQASAAAVARLSRPQVAARRSARNTGPAHPTDSRTGYKTASLLFHTLSDGIVFPQPVRPRANIFAMRTLFPCLIALAAASILSAARNLEVYSIDVEGGQATLVVSPSGESLLVDTGWAGFNKRDADRIAAAAKSAGIKKIDYLVITHYHSDHVGGVPQLAEKLPIVNFVDHGASVEDSKQAQVLFNAYSAFREKGHHIQVKPGDTIPIKGIEVKVLTAGGEAIDKPLPGAGQPNPECASFKAKAPDATENAQSVGILITYGKFRMVDLGDLTWNKEKDLVCPVNKIGPVDLYLVSHHGMDASGSPQLVHALHPKVALINNGAKKGGSPDAWQIIHDSPGLQDIWQLHFAVAGGKDRNSADPFLANIDEICEGKGIRVEVLKDGSFKLANSRNKYEKSYR
jgi:competence protein ComEC